MKKWVKKFLYQVLIIVYNIVFEVYVGIKCSGVIQRRN